jgi:hypothetical protein
MARVALFSCVLVALGSACGLATLGEDDSPTDDGGLDAGSDVRMTVAPDSAYIVGADTATAAGDSSTSSGPTDTGMTDSELPTDSAVVADAADAADSAIVADAADSAVVPDAADSAVVPDAADSAVAPDAADTAPTLGFCASQLPQPTFCDDFDETTDAGAGWDGVIAGANSSTVVDSTHAISTPNSLHTTTSSGNAAGLTKVFTVSSTFQLDLDVLFAALPSSGGDLAPLEIMTSVHYIYFYASQGQAYFQWGTNEISNSVGTVNADAWHHISLTLTVGTSSTLTASVDGTTLWTDFSLGSLESSPKLTLEVGTPSLYDAMMGETFIDNVVVTAQ